MSNDVFLTLENILVLKETTIKKKISYNHFIFLNLKVYKIIFIQNISLNTKLGYIRPLIKKKNT